MFFFSFMTVVTTPQRPLLMGAPLITQIETMCWVFVRTSTQILAIWVKPTIHTHNNTINISFDISMMLATCPEPIRSNRVIQITSLTSEVSTSNHWQVVRPVCHRMMWKTWVHMLIIQDTLDNRIYVWHSVGFDTPVPVMIINKNYNTKHVGHSFSIFQY